jgi:hypothetical protein
MNLRYSDVNRDLNLMKFLIVFAGLASITEKLELAIVRTTSGIMYYISNNSRDKDQVR